MGDDATNRSSTTVWVRENATVFDVMNAAAQKDRRFRFEYDTASGLGPYVVSLSGVPRNVEAGHFWLAHVMNFDTGLVTSLSVGKRSQCGLARKGEKVYEFGFHIVTSMRSCIASKYQ
ncbi:hypothetical protein V5799_017789 [Amblyomma americanum]|uniref:Uncharacterized protein n=1 Tax=Amblyomma americanum TaxID=6943 RepID=A0AAQ4F1R6_AMBAM